MSEVVGGYFTGYDLVKGQFRGFSEIESRSDRGKCLLQIYQSRNPIGFDKSGSALEIGSYMATGIYLEVILNQYINLENLDSRSFQNMFLRSLEVYDIEKSELKYFGYLGLAYCTASLSRMMKLRDYGPFISLYETNSFVFDLTEFYGPTDSSIIELVHEMAIEYSKNL